MRTRGRWVAAGLIVLTAACSSGKGPQRRDPPAEQVPLGALEVKPGAWVEPVAESGLVVTGTARDHGGRPLGAAQVRLERVVDGFSALICILCPPPPSCVVGDSMTTTADGRFELQVCRNPKQWFMLQAQLPAADKEVHGARTWYEFRGAQAPRALPGPRLWDPELRLDMKRGEASWPHLPPDGFGRRGDYELWFTRNDERILEFIWAENYAYPPQKFDPRVLEDARGSWSVLAHARARPRRGCGRRRCAPVEIVYRSRALPFRGPGAPPSRGKPCLVAEESRRARRLANCPMTDGNLRRDEGGSLRSAAVDLGRGRPISLVVVRNCFFCAIHTSMNGRDWRFLEEPFENLNEDTGIAVVPVANRRARYVRVTERGGLNQLSEISVW